MSARTNPLQEARRRARHQLDELLRDLRQARHSAGLSQHTVAHALGISRQLLSEYERGGSVPALLTIAAWGAALGLDVPVRSFPAGSPLRDAGQLRILARTRDRIGETWQWLTEVPVTTDPLDRRTIDAVIRRIGVAIGLEVITRLTDAQQQVRRATLKQEAAQLDRMLLVLADSRHNRLAVVDAQPTLAGSFPTLGRPEVHALRVGRLPASNGLLFV